MSDKTEPIEPDAPCCQAWTYIHNRFDWMVFTTQPNMRGLPHIKVDDVSWRVNYCPACGKKAPSVVGDKQ
jgi:hypothetical protein